MIICTETDNPELAERYQHWLKASDKPIIWQQPLFELEIYFGGNGFVLYAWQTHRLTFRTKPLDYYQLDYCSSVTFWEITRRMDREALHKRYKSQVHANTRWFDLMCQAYDLWWDTGKPGEFRFIA